jgi:hypothetical protein
MLVLEIAGGIILAVILLGWWREILTIGFAGAATVVGVFVVVSALDTFGILKPLGRLLPWAFALLVLYSIGNVFYHRLVTGTWHMSEEAKSEWEEKSTSEKWVHRVCMWGIGIIFGFGGLMALLDHAGLLK